MSQIFRSHDYQRSRSIPSDDETGRLKAKTVQLDRENRQLRTDLIRTQNRFQEQGKIVDIVERLLTSHGEKKKECERELLVAVDTFKRKRAR